MTNELNVDFIMRKDEEEMEPRWTINFQRQTDK